jgi:hypothetical protein
MAHKNIHDQVIDLLELRGGLLSQLRGFESGIACPRVIKEGAGRSPWRCVEKK